MIWYRLSRFDRLLIITAAVVMLVSSVAIFEDRWLFTLLSSSEDLTEKIGFAKTSVNDVRRRHGTAFSWLPLEKNAKIYQGDSIFTGEKSEAVILTDRGEQISISPNSLVVINAKTDSIRLDIDYGSVLGQVGRDKKLLIGSGGDVTEFKGDDALVKIDVSEGKNLKVNVLEGQVEVASKDGRKTLGPNQQAEISDAGAVVDPSDIRIELLSPVPDRILKPDEARDLMFTWRSSYPFSEFTVEVSRDPEFSSPLVREKVNRSIFRPTGIPPNERLYWRVLAILRPELGPAKSTVSAFTVAEDNPPAVTFPRDNMKLSFEEQPIEEGRQVKVVTQWQARSASNRWEIQFARSPDFSEQLRILESTSPSADLGSLDDGTYYLRVRAKDWAEAAWSNPTAFSILRKPAAMLRPPAVLTSEDEFILVTRSEGFTAEQIRQASPSEFVQYVESIPELAWNTIPGATSYEIQIAKDPSFSNVVLNDLTAATRYSWNTVNLGQFYWRTRSVSPGNRKGPYTKAQPLMVKLSPPKSLIPEKVVEEVTSLSFMESAPPPFILQWTPTLYAEKYEIEFDKSPAFAKPLKVFTNFAFKKVQAPTAGVYYWRVRSLDVSGRPITEWMTAQKYDFMRAYLSPETTKELKALYPNNETIMLIGSGDLKINFRWASPVKDSQYRIQFSSSKEFTKPILDLVTPQTQYLVENDLADGWYYWRIRVESKTFTSPWTAPYPFQIKHVIESFDFSESEKIQEQQLSEYEKERAVAAAAQEKLRVDQEAKQKELADQNVPQLPSPEDLVGPEQYILEAKPYPPSLGRLEKLPTNDHYKLLRDRPLLEWESVANATDYKIEFSNNEDFSALIYSTTVNLPSYRWSTARPGTYFWRVQALAKDRRPSSYSSVAKIELTLPQSKISTPIAMMLSVDSGVKTVPLVWSPMLFARNYQVFWSTSSDLKAPITKVVDATKYFQPVSQEGTYYWKVLPLDESGRPLAQKDELQVINVALMGRMPAQIAKPELLYPRPDENIETLGAESPRVSFLWRTPPTQGTFKLEIAKDEKFRETLARYTTNKSDIIVDLPATEGTLYWKLTLMSQGKIIWESPARPMKLMNSRPRRPATQ